MYGKIGVAITVRQCKDLIGKLNIICTFGKSVFSVTIELHIWGVLVHTWGAMLHCEHLSWSPVQFIALMMEAVRHL